MEIRIFNLETGVPNYIGTIDLDCVSFSESEAEECFRICDWSCWSKAKPKNLHSNICMCSHGIAFQTPTTETWLALSLGWLHGTPTEIGEYAMKHQKDIWWE